MNIHSKTKTRDKNGIMKGRIILEREGGGKREKVGKVERDTHRQ